MTHGSTRVALLTLLVGAVPACPRPAPSPTTAPPRAAAPRAPRTLGPSDIDYELRYLRRPAGPVLQVDLRFRGDPSGRTGLLLPGRWAFVPDFHRWTKNLRAVTPGVRIAPGARPHFRLLDHRPGQRLHLRYEVHARPPDPRLGQSNRYYHVLRPEGFQFVGHAAIAIPAWSGRPRRRVVMRWVGLPARWTLANSFGASQRTQRFGASVFELRHATYLGGDFRLVTRAVRGQTVHVAIRGRWRFTDAALADLVAKTVRVHRGFWRDWRIPYFLVVVAPLPGKCCAYGGLGFTHSVVLYLNTRGGLGKELLWLVVHELFHAWLGDRIRPVELDQRHRWFFEGFTEYFAHLLILRHFTRSLPAYVAELNGKLQAYHRSPRRTATLKEVRAGMWTDPRLYRLAYLRGHLLASNWHAALQRATGGRHGLGDVMREVLGHVRRHRKRFTVKLLGELTRRRHPGWIDRAVQDHIVDGRLVAADPRALGPCVTLAPRTFYRFDLGFDWPTTQRTRRLGQVRPGGPAHRAGLRSGEQVWGWKLRLHDPDTPVQLYVRRRGRLRWVGFLPRRGKGWTVPQYRLDTRRWQKSPAACLAWFQERPLGTPADPRRRAISRSGGRPRASTTDVRRRAAP